MTMASAYRPPVQQSKVKQVPTVSITSSDLLRKAFTYSFTEPEQAYNTKKTKTTAQKKVGQLRSQERLPTSKVSGIVNLTEVKAVKWREEESLAGEERQELPPERPPRPPTLLSQLQKELPVLLHLLLNEVIPKQEN
eukprot:CAMPEP_0202961112 /NCGR_PEP_ID=MMETSP1396-20130829/5188_1 /ASSEMBLY_ACC=CAM_ASM_000872 /TAXON_ID= /ORGANISM="Pseudokeronopsis sp., Strain Brazil" /LENGTH=136 /DNA_ID=CAMNT_0049680717 /DNA_START=132 /DNA_END=541 /DNA_ORIENTATION=+